MGRVQCIFNLMHVVQDSSRCAYITYVTVRSVVRAIFPNVGC